MKQDELTPGGVLRELISRDEYGSIRLPTQARDMMKQALASADKHRLDRPALMKEAKEIVLEIRQYLCNTEFAEEPFKSPVDINKLTVEFPKRILALFDEEEIRKMTLRKVGKLLEQFTEGDIYGDKRTGDYMLFQMPPQILEALKQGKFPEGG